MSRQVPVIGNQAQQQNPLHITFKNPDWPANYLSPENVLEYFCNPANRFYDTSCNNQQIKMQNLNDKPLEENLIKTVGIQYVLWSAQPPLYVICKHRRNSPQNVTPLAYYYIINGVVYQAPDMHTFVQSRMLAVVDPLKKAFDEVMSMSRFNVAKGYYWQFKNKPVESENKKEKEEDKPLMARWTNFQLSRTNPVMKQLFEDFPIPDMSSTSKQDDDALSVYSGGSVATRAAENSEKSEQIKRPRL